MGPSVYNRKRNTIDVTGRSDAPQRRGRSSIIPAVVLALCCLPGNWPTVGAEEPPRNDFELSGDSASQDQASPVAEPITDPGENEKDEDSLDSELDSLLEQDLGSLRRTSVAPSLDVEVSSVSRQKSTIG